MPYLYRDADNYKVHNECVVQGTISAEQIAVILECLDEGEYFIPHLVGLPEKRFDTFDPQVDHPYFELSEDSFAETMESETVEVQVDELVSAFLCCKGKWEQIDPDRTMELLNILIDEKVNDEGGHGYRVVERLVELGFSKKELMVLKFAEGNYDVFPITAIPTREMDRESAGTSENGACNVGSTEASDIVEWEEPWHE